MSVKPTDYAKKTRAKFEIFDSAIDKSRLFSSACSRWMMTAPVVNDRCIPTDSEGTFDCR